MAYIKCNIAITQTDNSAMTTVLMFYRQTPRHSNFEGRVIPAESQWVWKVKEGARDNQTYVKFGLLKQTNKQKSGKKN